jgi:ribokinase
VAAKRRSALTIGSALIDTIALIDSDRIERMSMNNADRAYLLLEEGKKTEAALISTHAGGGAINAAVSFARQGYSTSTIAKLGRDARGETIKAILHHEDVALDFLSETNDAATGASVLISSHDKNAAIFTFRGANSLIDSQDLAAAAFKSDIVYVCSLSDHSADLFPQIIALAAAAKAFIATNPGIRQLSARGDAIEHALPQIDLLSMNREEAAALVPRLMSRQDKPNRRISLAHADHHLPLMRRGLTFSGFDMGFVHFIDALLNLGPKCVLVTDGRHGAYAAMQSEIVFCPALDFDVVVGTAGAGDAFSSTFAAQFASGASPSVALQHAAINAASVVAFADTQTGLLSSDALKERRDAYEGRMPTKTWHFE